MVKRHKEDSRPIVGWKVYGYYEVDATNTKGKAIKRMRKKQLGPRFGVRGAAEVLRISWENEMKRDGYTGINFKEIVVADVHKDDGLLTTPGH